jgi:hypothetical protein
VSALGAVASKVASGIADGLAACGIPAPAVGGSSRVHVVEHAYGVGIAEVFLLGAPLGLVALAALLLMREVPLGRKSGIELARGSGLMTRSIDEPHVRATGRLALRRIVLADTEPTSQLAARRGTLSPPVGRRRPRHRRSH